MKSAIFEEIPRPSQIITTVEQLDDVAEKALLRIKEAQMLGDLACKAEVARVRTFRMPTASWSSEIWPTAKFTLIDQRQLQGWFFLSRTEMRGRKNFRMQAFVFNGHGAVTGVARILEAEFTEEDYSTSLSRSLMMSHADLKLVNPPAPRDMEDITSIFALVPISSGHTAQKR